MTMEEKNYLVSGMHCAGCAAKVERAVEGLEGVERVELNLLTGKMTVLFEKPDSPAMERNRRKRAVPASFGPFCCWFL